MLIITRRVGQSLFIGDAEVVILQDKGKRVRLGIKAPEDVHIFRAELRERDEEEVRLAVARRDRLGELIDRA